MITVGERKARRLNDLRLAVSAIQEDLRDYARSHGGRFVIFGSFARGEARFDSDLDIMVDFPTIAERAAWFYAERSCIDRGVKPDIHLATESGDDLMARVSRDGIVIE